MPEEMSLNQQVYEYVRAHPGSTATHVSAALKVSASSAAARLSVLFNSNRLTREEDGRTLAGITRYRYSINPNVSPPNFRAKYTKHGEKRSKRDIVPSVAPQPSVAPAVAQPPAAPSGLDDILGQLAGSLVDSLMPRLVPMIRERLHERLQNALQEVTAAELPQVLTAPVPAPTITFQTPPTAAAVNVRPIVGVTGLLPIQCGQLQEDFGEQIEFRFWDEGSDKSKLKSMARECEVVFIHVRHARHSVDELLKAHRANIRRVTGGLSNMRVSIRSYFEGKVK